MTSFNIVNDMKPLFLEIYNHYGQGDIADQELSRLAEFFATSRCQEFQFTLLSLHFRLSRMDWKSFSKEFVLEPIRHIRDLYQGSNLQSMGSVYPFLLSECCEKIGYTVYPEQTLGSSDCDLFISSNDKSDNVSPLLYNILVGHNRSRKDGIPIECKSVGPRNFIREVKDACSKFKSYQAGVLAFDLSVWLDRYGPYTQNDPIAFESEAKDRLAQCKQRVIRKLNRNRGELADYRQHCPLIIITTHTVSGNSVDENEHGVAVSLFRKSDYIVNNQFRPVRPFAEDTVESWGKKLGDGIGSSWSLRAAGAVMFNQPLRIDLPSESVSVELSDTLEVSRIKK